MTLEIGSNTSTIAQSITSGLSSIPNDAHPTLVQVKAAYGSVMGFITKYSNNYGSGVLSRYDGKYYGVSINDGIVTVEELALNSKFGILLTPTNASAKVTIVSGGYIKVGAIVIVNVHITVDQSVTGDDTICVFPAPLNSNQAVIPMAPSSSGIGNGKIMYIRENGEARFFQGESSGASYNISGAYIARS